MSKQIPTLTVLIVQYPTTTLQVKSISLAMATKILELATKLEPSRQPGD